MPRSTHTGSVCLPPVASQPRFIDQTVEQCAKGAVSCPLATTADRLRWAPIHGPTPLRTSHSGPGGSIRKATQKPLAREFVPC